jgi:topoisomerase-4 subunit A
MGKQTIPPDSEEVQPIGVKDALAERYLAYALSTIMHRALPDARDGLKPVHRRLIYAMRQLRLDPGAAFKKCARVVGDVIGKYHPHGDQSVYDAMVRLAQDFAQRYPLVDGQGNFGNVDGDNAAAMRYTEARLTEVARLMLDGI